MRFRYSTGKNGSLEKKAVVYTKEEHKIDRNDVDIEAVNIIKRLEEAGYETYIVGGAVRDLILGKKPKDFDIASEASPQTIRRIFRNSRIIGRRFKLVHVYFGIRIFEVSTFRSLRDGVSGNTYGSISEDVMRRDFSMNALFYDPQKQIIVDYVGGFKDIKKQLVRPIIPLSTIFKDDPVRMIRAVKYGVRAGFTLPFLLSYKIKKQSALLAGVSPSRLTEEIFKIVNSGEAAETVFALNKMGLYKFLQPNAAKLIKENPEFAQRYFKSLEFLNKSDSKHAKGEKFLALINDYLDDIVDWNKGLLESYRAAYAAARRFVQPMNPPRFEVDNAVRLFFQIRGHVIKRSALVDLQCGNVKADTNAARTETNAGTNIVKNSEQKEQELGARQQNSTNNKRRRYKNSARSAQFKHEQPENS